MSIQSSVMICRSYIKIIDFIISNSHLPCSVFISLFLLSFSPSFLLFLLFLSHHLILLLLWCTLVSLLSILHHVYSVGFFWIDQVQLGKPQLEVFEGGHGPVFAVVVDQFRTSQRSL